MMGPIRVGVVGVGRMGQRHCRVYNNLRGARLAGVYDSNLGVAESVSRQYDVPCFATLDDLLAQVDAVTIAAPTNDHFDLGLRCINRRVHMLIEKPITTNVTQAEALKKAGEKSGLKIMVGHIERFNPAYIELKPVLSSMQVLAIDIHRLSPFAGSNKDVDVVSDLMIHDIDLVLDLLGHEPDLINAYGLSLYNHLSDHAVVTMSYQEGPLVTLTASRLTEHKVRRIEVTARDAYVEVDLLNKTIYIHRQTTGEYQNLNHKGVKYHQESIIERIMVPVFEPLFLQLQHFINCILEDEDVSIPISEGVCSLSLVDKIHSLSQEIRLKPEKPELSEKAI